MTLAPSKAINLKTKQLVDVSELKELVAFAGIGLKQLVNLQVQLSNIAC